MDQLAFGLPSSIAEWDYNRRNGLLLTGAGFSRGGGGKRYEKIEVIRVQHLPVQVPPMKRPTLASILFVTLPAIVLAQSAIIEHQATAKPDTNSNAGIFAEFDPNGCKPGPLPTVRLLTPPTHGNVTMTQVNLHADSKCAGMDVPAWMAIYRSNKDFIGQDSFTVELKNAVGQIKIQKTTVTVK